MNGAPAEHDPTLETVQRAKALVMRYGWNATAFQIVNPGISHWFSPSVDAVVGFILAARTRVVAGAPVCDMRVLSAVIEEFEADAGRARERVCYFGVAGRVHDLLGKLPSHSVVILGAQPSWDLRDWDRTITSKKSLRAQLHRAMNKGTRVEEWPAARATEHPGMQKCLTHWLATRGLPPLHFLIEPQTLSRLDGRRIFVALRGQDIAGFVVVSPIPTRNGWLTEQFVRGRHACNGTIELLLDHAARVLGNDGARYFTMGLVPLSKQNWSAGSYNPAWLRWVMRSTRMLGRAFYNFDGLEAFKMKFMPHHWEPIYAISNEERFSMPSLWAIAHAFSGRSMTSLFCLATYRAACRLMR